MKGSNAPLRDRLAFQRALTINVVPILGFVVILIVTSAAKSQAQVNTDSSPPRVRLGSVDEGTRWGFRLRSPVTVGSPIVRLGDVAEPLDSNLAAWSRLKRSPIGLLPLTSQPMTIRRDRLERAILDAEATPLAIDWIGPDNIVVSYRPSKELSSPDSSFGNHSHAQTVAQRLHVTTVAFDGEVPQGPKEDSISLTEARRIEQLILNAIDRNHAEISKQFRIEFATDRTELRPLQDVQSIATVEPIEPIAAGDCSVQIVGRAPGGTTQAVIHVNLIPHPKVVVAKRMLPKGHRLSPQDLELQAIPESELSSDHVLEFADLEGQEARTTLRAGRPLHRAEIGPATLIRKGDLVEVRVLGGGVTVTTNAKAQNDGAEFDLIEVETTDPRKRLLARVVQSGLVEVVTRVPRVVP